MGKILNGSNIDWGQKEKRVCTLAASQTKANADARPPAVVGSVVGSVSVQCRFSVGSVSGFLFRSFPILHLE